jgi:hypothetical protein
MKTKHPLFIRHPWGWDLRFFKGWITWVRNVRLLFWSPDGTPNHSRKIRLWPLLFLFLALPLWAQPTGFHYQTNVVLEPCRYVHYYGVCTNGEIQMIHKGVADHDAASFEWCIHTNHCEYVTVFRVNSLLDGVATVRHVSPVALPVAGSGPRTHRPVVAMPPLPPAPAARKELVIPLAPPLPTAPIFTAPTTSALVPQTWSEWPFSYTAVSGQEPQFDWVTLQQTGWQLWFQFMQQSNRCYRICCSNEAGWRPLSSICRQTEDSMNIFRVPVYNPPIDWNVPDNTGQWSAMTNLVTTADLVSYKLEVNQ